MQAMVDAEGLGREVGRFVASLKESLPQGLSDRLRDELILETARNYQVWLLTGSDGAVLGVPGEQHLN